MFWRWFQSSRPVFESLEETTGYDMSPVTLQAPANTEDACAPEPHSTQICTDYSFSLPTKKTS